jgi:hypothetical protein
MQVPPLMPKNIIIFARIRAGLIIRKEVFMGIEQSGYEGIIPWPIFAKRTNLTIGLGGIACS